MANISDKRDLPEITEEEVAYLGTHLEELRAWQKEGRFLRWSLGAAFVLGLVAHVVGYVLRSSDLGEPFRLAADLVYGVGLALWTGVVAAFFIQVFPEVKRRQLKQYLDAYDAKVKASRAKR